MVRLIPLGGLGAIGSNCLLIEQGDPPERLLVDCGLTFSHADDGVDAIHPSFEQLAARGESLLGLVLTHGHEDHVGAVPWLVRALARHRAQAEPLVPLPIWGSPYALAVCRHRLREERLLERVDCRPLPLGRATQIGSFTVEPIAVAHSIPDAVALAIGTRAGTVVHSGDFKFVAAPSTVASSGELVQRSEAGDEARLKALGDASVALLLSDSTNALAEGFAGGEGPVTEALVALVAAAKRRVVVGLFGSNLQRLDALAVAAQRSKRRLCLLGRSLRKHAEIGRTLGLLDWPSDLLVAPDVAAAAAPDKMLYAATGTQAEPRGALRRLARSEHRDLALSAGDLVVFSSRVIPGHEPEVYAMIGDLIACGAEVVTGAEHAELHVSGHGKREDQRRMLELLRPKSFVPIHGSGLQLARHLQLARSLGVSDALHLRDGDAICLSAEGIARDGAWPTAPVATAHGIELSRKVLAERRQLGRGGLVVVTLIASRGAPGVVVRCLGVPKAIELQQRVANALRSRLQEADGATVGDETLRRVARRAVSSLIGGRTQVLIQQVAEEDA